MAMAVTYTNFCGRIVAENRGGVERSYVRDTLGSTIALLDDTQTLTDSWDYWPFGEVAVRTGTSPTPFGFAGTMGYYTGILSQIYVKARFLRVILARWLTVDPFWPGESAYCYVDGNPCSLTDSSGLGGGCSPKCTKCYCLLKKIDDADGVAQLLNCLMKSGNDREGILGCLNTYGKNISQQAWNAVKAYLACMLASGTAGGTIGNDPCTTPGGDAQSCCYEGFLLCLFNCAGKTGSTLGICIVKCKSTFEKCGFANAF